MKPKPLPPRDQLHRPGRPVWSPATLYACSKDLAYAAVDTGSIELPNHAAMANLITATAWHESAKLRAVLGDYSPKTKLPASFGICQVQLASATDSLTWLKDHGTIGLALTRRLLHPHCPDTMNFHRFTPATLLVLSTVHHPLSLALCLLHYLRLGITSCDSQEQAADVWKTHYNTPKGTGTQETFLQSLALFPYVLAFGQEARLNV